MAVTKKETYTIKTFATIFSLIFLYPIGAVMMFAWMDWPKKTKIIALFWPFILSFAIVIFGLIGGFLPAFFK